MAKSRDWDELLYVWSEWRRKSGENIKDMYEQLMELTNEAANYNSIKCRFQFIYLFNDFFNVVRYYNIQNGMENMFFA